MVSFMRHAATARYRGKKAIHSRAARRYRTASSRLPGAPSPPRHPSPARARGVLQRRAGIVDLVNDQDALADEVVHLTERAEVEPLRTGDLGARLLLDGARGETLVKGQADSLDGMLGLPGFLRNERRMRAGT